MTDIMAVSELRKSFGALRVADRISFVVRQGEILGIIGPNGAGKTTLFGLLAGNISADSGRIEFDGADVTRLPAHDRARAGLARTYQVPRPFTHMTVFDNLLVAARFGGDMDEAEAETWVERVIAAMGLRAERNTLAGRLPLLMRKRHELARALATRPKLVLVDEVAAGLTDAEVEQFIALIRGIRRFGHHGGVDRACDEDHAHRDRSPHRPGCGAAPGLRSAAGGDKRIGSAPCLSWRLRMTGRF